MTADNRLPEPEGWLVRYGSDGQCWNAYRDQRTADDVAKQWRGIVERLYTEQQVRALLAARDAEAGRDSEDAARYRFLRDSQNCSLSISHNDHHNMYETLEQVFEHHGGDPKSDYYGDIPADERAAMIAADSLWTLHIYPNSPVGFNVYHGATLDAAIDAARAGEER
jgi:hypothetical protein